jgi:subtilisin family serine protease
LGASAIAGLDQIDRRLLPLDKTYTYSETGKGVHVYVIDTGLRITHQGFGSPSRAFLGQGFVGDNFGAPLWRQ